MDTLASIFAIVLLLIACSFYVAAEGRFLLCVLNTDEHRIGKAHITYQVILAVEDQPVDATPSKDDIAPDQAVTESESVDNTDQNKE